MNKSKIYLAMIFLFFMMHLNDLHGSASGHDESLEHQNHKIIVAPLIPTSEGDQETFIRLDEVKEEFWDTRGKYKVHWITQNADDKRNPYENALLWKSFYTSRLDLSLFTNVRVLDLWGVDHLERLPNLGKIDKVTIHGMKILIDVNGLRGVRNVEISDCWNLRDVSPLATVKDVELSWMGATNVDALSKVPKLRLVHMLDLAALPVMENQDLTLVGSFKGLDLGSLTAVPKLKLMLTNHVDVSVLKSTPYLILMYMHSVVGIQNLTDVKKLALVGFHQPFDTSTLDKIPQLIIISLWFKLDISKLGHNGQICCIKGFRILNGEKEEKIANEYELLDRL